MKKQIHLNESELHRLINESVKKVLNEIGNTKKGQYALGQASARYTLRNAEPLDDNDSDYEDAQYNKFYDYAQKNDIGNNFDEYEQGFQDYVDKQEIPEERRNEIRKLFIHLFRKNYEREENYYGEFDYDRFKNYSYEEERRRLEHDAIDTTLKQIQNKIEPEEYYQIYNIVDIPNLHYR